MPRRSPRVDLHYKYTRLPDKPSDAFPEQREIWLPVVEVLLVNEAARKAFRAPALLDTGSTITLFGCSYAEALGIDWRGAPQMIFRGVGSTGLVGYAADLKLVLPQANHAWPVRVVFSPVADKPGFPLLGHTGFFEHFEVRFRASQRSFRVTLK